ncbi:hypothetical protein [Falsirhodobacter sp. 20TX0035]|uniref:hypothetical protein n=1 Tax=Falsirhodobacter sp. 20TX0035 TaxID=3022019 RepID=UPI00232CAA50|nr:hypothetical protein [Falsirhodobacter sp. 20TX0035]MDB6455042.1 hypothetical protein [Falsirhodobacter sp. 20TX0035]
MDERHKGLQGGLLSLSACAYAAGLPKLAEELVRLIGIIPTPLHDEVQAAPVKLVHTSSLVRKNAVHEHCAMRAVS